MSKYHDDRTHASNPGRIGLSTPKLRRFHPRPTASFPDDLIAEHLALGDSRAAVVMSTRPLRVAAYTDELDCVAILDFPQELVEQYGLAIGSRLLTVNTYLRGSRVAGDLTPGPHQLPCWVNFWPLIAEFLSDDLPSIEDRKRAIEEEEWRRALAQGQAALDQHSGRVRDGRPYLSIEPKPVGVLARLIRLLTTSLD